MNVCVNFTDPPKMYSNLDRYANRYWHLGSSSLGTTDRTWHETDRCKTFIIRNGITEFGFTGLNSRIPADCCPLLMSQTDRGWELILLLLCSAFIFFRGNSVEHVISSSQVFGIHPFIWKGCVSPVSWSSYQCPISTSAGFKSPIVSVSVVDLG